ncbi:MAG: 3-oxoacyl-[acyl-carrier-protein] reductase [Planctomycetes bacterium]|nr:3-oxoacyl-[acyl-carrier-protein] reductase [Planctomycetota bacterium]MBU4398381.1 3-oxoacyl-[acyl-carrier-protein] reductase [Planctomycetota bacterium]MCG2683380.1 3-oxoacyl-[acyl-carrier-protein] reductase [Planctomycetales bacterium]
MTNRITTDLSGQTAIVTGAARGLGRCIAQSLAAAGAQVACVDINAVSLADTVAAIRGAGGAAEPLACDVTDAGGVAEVVDEVVKRCGALNILVNNAGITRDNVIVRMKDEQWDAVININLRGTFLFTRAAARPMMKNRRGRIINVASVSGLKGNPGQANYSASKAGVIGLTRTVARELAGRNITVNAVAPGFIATDMTAALGEEILTEVRKQIPLGRLGDPQDVADAVLFLASDAASFITGHVLTIDGGLTV